MIPKEIEQLRNGLFGKYGARKKGRNWLFENRETVCHVKLEANRWRRHEYDLPFWVFVRELWTGSPLLEPLWQAPHSHIFGSRYSPDLPQSLELERCLNLAQEFDQVWPAHSDWNSCVTRWCCRSYLKLGSVDGIRRAHREGLLAGKALHRDLQVFLATFVD